MGIAIRDRLISLDDSVGKYISEYKNGANGKLKVRHLLTMSSGLNWDESYNSLFSLTTKAYYGTNLTKLVTGLKVIEEPGKIFRYMSCNTVLLSMIVSIVLGTLLLCLPCMQIESLSFIDILFTSASLTTVTGMLTVPIEHFTELGQLVMLIMMQLGGIGLMTMSLCFIYMFRHFTG